MTEEEKLNEMSGALATETIDEAPLRLPPQGGENADDTPEHEPSTLQGGENADDTPEHEPSTLQRGENADDTPEHEPSTLQGGENADDTPECEPSTLQGGENADDTPEHEPSTPQGEPEKGFTEEKTAAEKELEDLTGKMGAEGILEMIRGNRNMIIDQLIAEAKEKQGRGPMSSGISGAGNAHSIFDIAAMA